MHGMAGREGLQRASGKRSPVQMRSTLLRSGRSCVKMCFIRWGRIVAAMVVIKI